MGIKGTEQELTTLDLNTTEGGKTIDTILTNLYLLGGTDASITLNLYQGLMGAKTMDDDDPDQTEADDDYEFVSNLYKEEILDLYKGKKKKAALAQFVNEKGIVTKKNNSKYGTIVWLVQRGINELYKVSGVKEAPLVEDGNLGGNTTKAIEAITTYFTALDHVEALGQASGIETLGKDLFNQEGASDGVSADLVILLDQLLYRASQKPKDPTVDTRPVDSSFQTITQRAVDLGPLKRDDGFHRALNENDFVEEFRYVMIDGNMDYTSQNLVFVEYRLNKVLTAIFVISNEGDLQAHLKDGKTVFSIDAPSDEALEKGKAAKERLTAAEMQYEAAVAAEKPETKEIEKAAAGLSEVKSATRKDRMSAQYLLIGEQAGKKVGEYHLPIYQDIEDDALNYTSVASMGRKFVMDKGDSEKRENPRSIYRIVGTTHKHDLGAEVGSEEEWGERIAYELEFSRDLYDPNEIRTISGGTLLKGKRERVIATGQNTGYIVPRDLQEHELMMPSPGEIKHFEHDLMGFEKEPVEAGGKSKNSSSGKDRLLVVDLDNPFGDEVALVRKEGQLYVGLRSSKESSFVFYMLHGDNAAGVNTVLDAGETDVKSTRHHNRVVFHNHNYAEVPKEAEIFQMNTIIDGSEAGKRSLSLYLNHVAYNWDIIFNTVVKEQIVNQELRGGESFNPSTEMEPYQNEGLVYSQKGDERRLEEQSLDAYQFLMEQPLSSVGDKLQPARQNIPKAFEAAGASLEALNLPGGNRYVYREIAEDKTDAEKFKHFKGELDRLKDLNPRFGTLLQYQFDAWKRSQVGYLDFLVKQFESLYDFHDLIEKEAGKDAKLHPVSAVFYSKAAPYVPIPVNLHLVEKNGLFYLAYRNEVDESLNRFYEDGEESALDALKDGLARLDEDATLGEGHLFTHLSGVGKSSGTYSFQFNNPWKDFNEFMGNVMMAGVAVLIIAAGAASMGVGAAVVGGMVAAGTAATTITGAYFAYEAVDRLWATSGRSMSDVMFDLVDILGGVGGLASALARFAKATSRIAKYKNGLEQFAGGVEAAANVLALTAVGVKMGVDGKGFDPFADGLNVLAGVAEGMKFFNKRCRKAKPNPNPTGSHPKMWDATKPNDKLLAEVDDQMEKVFKGLTKTEQDEYLKMLGALDQKGKLRFTALMYSLQKSSDLQLSTVKKIMKKPPKGKTYKDNLEKVITLYTKPYLLTFNRKAKNKKAKKDFDDTVGAIESHRNGTAKADLDAKTEVHNESVDELDAATTKEENLFDDYKEANQKHSTAEKALEEAQDKHDALEVDLGKAQTELSDFSKKAKEAKGKYKEATATHKAAKDKFDGLEKKHPRAKLNHQEATQRWEDGKKKSGVMKTELETAQGTYNRKEAQLKHDVEALRLEKERLQLEFETNKKQYEEAVAAKQDYEAKRDKASGLENSYAGKVAEAEVKLKELERKSTQLVAAIDKATRRVNELPAMERELEAFLEKKSTQRLDEYKQGQWGDEKVKGGFDEVEKKIGHNKEGAKYRKLRGRLKAKRDQLANLQKERLERERTRNTEYSKPSSHKDAELQKLRQQIQNMEMELSKFEIHPQMEELAALKKSIQKDAENAKQAFSNESASRSQNQLDLQAEHRSLVEEKIPSQEKVVSENKGAQKRAGDLTGKLDEKNAALELEVEKRKGTMEEAKKRSETKNAENLDGRTKELGEDLTALNQKGKDVIAFDKIVSSFGDQVKDSKAIVDDIKSAFDAIEKAKKAKGDSNTAWGKAKGEKSAANRKYMKARNDFNDFKKVFGGARTEEIARKAKMESAEGAWESSVDDLEQAQQKVNTAKGEMDIAATTFANKKKVDDLLKDALPHLKEGYKGKRFEVGLEEVLKNFEKIEFLRTISLFKDFPKSYFGKLGKEEASSSKIEAKYTKKELEKALQTIFAEEAKLASVGKSVTDLEKMILPGELGQILLLDGLIASYHDTVAGYRHACINTILGLFRLEYTNEPGIDDFLAEAMSAFENDPQGFEQSLANDFTQPTVINPYKTPPKTILGKTALTQKFKGFYASVIAKHGGK